MHSFGAVFFPFCERAGSFRIISFLWLFDLEALIELSIALFHFSLSLFNVIELNSFIAFLFSVSP